MASDASPLNPGDLLRIERRYVVDGQLTCVMDEGKFVALERIGSAEHLVIKDGKDVRMFPLHAIAEIKLVKAKRRSSKAVLETAAAAAVPLAWDPSFV